MTREEYEKELKYVVNGDQDPCEDAISRQAAIDAMYDLCGEESLKDNPWRDNPHIDSIIDAIEHLHPVTPKQKMGRWIKVVTETDSFGNETYRYECSECGFFAFFGTERYCPYCGAKMEVSENG